jgi:hypothetical protein
VERGIADLPTAFRGIVDCRATGPTVAVSAGSFGVRASDNKYLDEPLEKVLCCFKAAAQATGAAFSYKTAGLRYAAFRSNSVMEQAFAENLEALNIGVALRPT